MRVIKNELIALHNKLKDRESTVYKEHFALIQALKSLENFKTSLNFEGKIADAFENYLNEALIPVNELCLLAHYELYRFYDGFMADFEYTVDDTGDCYIDTEELEFIKAEETKQFNYLQNNISIARGPEFRALDDIGNIYYEMMKTIDQTIDSVLDFDYGQMRKLETLDTVILEAQRGLNQLKTLDIKTYKAGSLSTQSWNLYYKSAQNELGTLYANSKEALLAIVKDETGIDITIPDYLSKEDTMAYILGIKNHLSDLKIYGWDKAALSRYVQFVNATLWKKNNIVDFMNGLAAINSDTIAIGSDVYMAMLESSKMKDKAKVKMIYNQSTQFGFALSASLTANSPFFKEFNELVFKSGILQDEVEKKEKNPKYKFSDEWVWLHVDFRNTLNNQILKKYEGLTGEPLLKALEEDGFKILLGASYMKKLEDELKILRKNNKGASKEELMKKIDSNALMAELIKINRFHNNSPNKIGVIKIVSDNQYGELEYNMFTGESGPGSYNYGYDFKTPTDVNYGHKKTDMDPSSLYKSNTATDSGMKIVEEYKGRTDYYNKYMDKDIVKEKSGKYKEDLTFIKTKFSNLISK